MEDDPARPPDHTADVGKNDRRAGWERLKQGQRVSRLTSDHPAYPRAWLDKYIQDQKQLLEHNGHAEIAVTGLQATWNAIETGMIAAVQARDPEAWSQGLDGLRKALAKAVDIIPISDRAMRRNYLVARALPDYLWPSLMEPPLAEPVAIVVNHGPAPVQQTLAPGEIMIRISNSEVAVRNIADHFLPLVTKAKEEILGHTTRPGRPPNLARNRAVAAIRESPNLPFNATQIAALLNISATKPKILREKIARYRRRGEHQNKRREDERGQARRRLGFD